MDPIEIKWPINGPPPKLTNVPYREPPPAANPVLRGPILPILASILQTSSILQWLFWKNAGFSKLRDIPGIYTVEARYEPTVIPRTLSSDQQDDAMRTAIKKNEHRSRNQSPFHTVKDYHDAYTAGIVTPLDVAEVLLSLVQNKTGSTAHYAKAFISTNAELTRKAAFESTERFRAGKAFGPLDGVPVAVKDEIDVQGYPTYIGTKIMYGDGTSETSWCVKMWQSEGAVILGKLSMHELGMDTTNNNPNYGTPLNPYNENYYTGGSSGGSGYASAVGLFPFTLGADGGGSIRIPSSYCGIYGLKPSHGRISIRPTPSLAISTAVVGPMAANMSDLELAYRVMATPDNENSNSRQFSAPVISRLSSKIPPIGICRPWFDRGDASVLKLSYEALDYLQNTCGCEVVDVSIPYLQEGQLAHAMTIMTEVLSGTPPMNIKQLTAPNRILMSVASQHPASDLLLAQRLRGLIMSHLAALYEKYPGMIIVTPTTPNAGWHIEGGATDLKYGISNANMSLRSMEYVWLANFSGCPAITCPIGFAAAKGEPHAKIPVGLMGMTEWGKEDALLVWGYQLEQWLNNVQGREKPPAWVDVLKLAMRQRGE